jgi:peptidoglycan/LPS O-acetylase OafA/YrhL
LTTRENIQVSPPRATFQPGLEGLRGIAVVVVLLFHDGFAWMSGGFLGVSTFFTLSGFLITGLLYSEFLRTGRIDLLKFWGRRFRRLMPAAFLTLAGIALFGRLAADATQQERLLGDGLSALFYVENWWLIASDAGYADLIGSPSPLQHFWSLAIEEQYYAIYPVVMLAGLALAGISRRTLALGLLLMMASAWAWMAWLAGTNVPTARIYFGSDTRSAELLAGGVLALVLWERTIPQRVAACISALGIAGLGVSAWFWITSSTEHTSLYQGGLIVYTAASVAIIAAAIQPGGPVRWLLSQRSLGWIGRVSYGAYLYHWPIYLWVDSSLTGLDGLWLTALRISLTALCAALSYRLLEEPIRSGRYILGWRRWVVPPLTASIIVGAFVAASGWESISHDRELNPTSPNNDKVTTLAPLRVLVLGDSVGHNIGQGLIHWAEETNAAAVVNGSLKGCGIARGGWIEGSKNRSRRICDDWEDAYARPVRNMRPDFVVVYSTAWDLIDRKFDQWPEPLDIRDIEFEQWLRSEYKAALDIFTAEGAHVVWISPVCTKRFRPDENTPRHPIRKQLLRERIVKPLSQESEQVTYFDLDTKVCPEGLFTNELEGMSEFRPDGNHFSDEGARWVGRLLGEALLVTADRE